MAKKNDNLTIYREKMQEQNKKLILRAIEHIKSLNGEINFSMVSKVTYDIADSLKGEKGITLAGISKNKLYRLLIEKAKSEQNIKNNKTKPIYQKSISMGDIQMNIHALRVENIELKGKIKILEHKLKNINKPLETMPNIDDNLIKQHNQIFSICFSLISRLLELELVYIDLKNITLNVAIYDEIIIQKESLELIYKDKIDEFKSKV